MKSKRGGEEQRGVVRRPTKVMGWHVDEDGVKKGRGGREGGRRGAMGKVLG